MTLAPLLGASAFVQAHAFAAVGAFTIGVVQLAAPKGTLPHRTLGWIWVLLMAVVALSSFRVTGLMGEGNYSPIHLLSVLTLVGLPVAVWAARRGRIAQHRRAMLLLFAGALLIAGAFTLLPGRIMHAVLLGS